MRKATANESLDKAADRRGADAERQHTYYQPTHKFEHVGPELAGLFAAVFVQHRHTDDVVDGCGDRRLGNAAQSGVHVHRLAHGQLVDERVELRAVAELGLGVLQRPRDAVTGQVSVAG